MLAPMGRISYKDHSLGGAELETLMRAHGFFPVERDFRSTLVRELVTLAKNAVPALAEGPFR